MFTDLQRCNDVHGHFKTLWLDLQRSNDDNGHFKTLWLSTSDQDMDWTILSSVVILNIWTTTNACLLQTKEKDYEHTTCPQLVKLESQPRHLLGSLQLHTAEVTTADVISKGWKPGSCSGGYTIPLTHIFLNILHRKTESSISNWTSTILFQNVFAGHEPGRKHTAWTPAPLYIIILQTHLPAYGS